MAIEEQKATNLLRPGTLEAGTNVLVSGPVMTGKRRLLFSLLAEASDADDGSILTTTRKTGETVVREFTGVDPRTRPADILRVIDSIGTQRQDKQTA